jgi:hypothetical protein
MMGIILTLVCGLLLLMAPVVSVASLRHMRGCGGWQGWGYLYNNTKGQAKIKKKPPWY